MPLSSKILRDYEVKGWKVYLPPQPGEEHSGSAADAENRRQPSGSSGETAEQMEELLKKVRNEGEELRRQLLEQAAEEAHLLKEQAWKDAFEEGRKKGEPEAARIIEEARGVLEQARKERREILSEAEPEIIKIAVSIAEKLLDYKIETDKECILSLMARALNALPTGRNVRLRLNPRDEKICRENSHLLQELLKREIDLELQGDDEIPAGNCLVESEEVEVELLLKKELHVLGNVLLEMANSSGKRYLLEEKQI